MVEAKELVYSASWPATAAAEALRGLARAAGLRPDARGAGARDATPDRSESLAVGERLAAAAAEADIELERVEVPYVESRLLLERSAPALLRVVPGGAEDVRLLALLRGGRRPVLLGSDGRRVRCDATTLSEVWCRPLERQVEPRIQPMLDATGLTGASRSRARRALLREHLAAVPVGGAWILRLPSGRRPLELARRGRLAGPAVGVAVCGLLASALSLAAWVPLARGLFSGRLEPAWVLAWVLLLASALPLRWLETWFQALFGLRFGCILRRRLMAGATRLDPDAVRGEGAGALLGRVLESEALEALLLSGGFVLLAALTDVALAAWVLAQGATPALSIALFLSAVLLAVALAWRYHGRAADQAGARLAVTHDLVERLTGKRTRLVQEHPADLHREEDRLLEEYLARSRRLDRATLWLTAGTGGAWLVLGGAGLAASFAGSAGTVGLAIGVGAVLLGTQALVRLSSGLSQLAACRVLWGQVRPLFEAARVAERPGLARESLRPGGDPRAAAEGGPDSAGAGSPLLRARALAYRHANRSEDALSGVDFEVRRGDRILVEGPSGGGKSTLLSLISGLRQERSGSLTLRGLDRASHGTRRWRRRVAAAPQFHENHVFGATFAFNLLLASPEAEQADLGDEAASLGDGPLQARAEERAREVCEELGLGALLARMPSGLRQNLGETGWQLSHGEQSRLFLARALLADASVVVLDESLSALDPITAARVLECVDRRCDAVIAAAHP